METYGTVAACMDSNKLATFDLKQVSKGTESTESTNTQKGKSVILYAECYSREYAVLFTWTK
jgi:hypothetical protein